MAFVINSWENVLDLNDPKKNIYRDIENKKIMSWISSWAMSDISLVYLNVNRVILK
jgi:hypothetical protein